MENTKGKRLTKKNRPTPIDKEILIPDEEVLISVTDPKGIIIETNDIFTKISGYSEDELIGSSHNIIRHPDMPKVIFKLLWENLKAGNNIKIFVKNLCKDGEFYWVLADVKVTKNPDGSFRNFVSTRKTMSKNAREIIEPFYAKLLNIENTDGILTSQKEFEQFLANNGENLNSINNAMIKIQNN